MCHSPGTLAVHLQQDVTTANKKKRKRDKVSECWSRDKNEGKGKKLHLINWSRQLFIGVLHKARFSSNVDTTFPRCPYRILPSL